MPAPDTSAFRTQDAGVPNLTFLRRDLTLVSAAAALGRELPPADVVAFTTGILPAKAREETAEGLERDMAVSCLSRLVALRGLLPRLPTGARVFVWGMPGNGAVTRLEDLNAEKSYEGGFGFVHMNTVGGNEALVLHLAATERARGGAAVFGMNPGLIATGIRDSVHGGRGGLLGRTMEGLIGLFTPSVEAYAAKTVPLMFAEGLEAHNGAMFNQGGDVILPNKEFLDAPGRAAEWYDAMEALLKRKTGL